jgi:hypothetical protein
MPNRFGGTDWHPDRMSEAISWTMAFDGTFYGNPWAVANPAQELINLPVGPTKQNADLLRICTAPPDNTH